MAALIQRGHFAAAVDVNIGPHEFLILAQIFPLTLISGVSLMYSDFRLKENDRYSNSPTGDDIMLI